MHQTHLTGLFAAITATGFFVGALAADNAKPGKPAAKADPIPAAARGTLEEAGLKVATGGLSLPEEAELGKALRESARLKKTMMAADRDVYAAQREVDAFKAQIHDLRDQYTGLSAEMANATTTAAQNRIIGALNATKGQIEQIARQGSESSDRLKEARKKASEIRESYVEEILPMRAKADEITRKWSSLAADAAVQDAVDAVNKALSTKFALKPSSSFAGNLKQLKTMEEAVASDAIKLENETNSLWVNVTINGKHKYRMVVDSGASSISLPDKMARDMGIDTRADGEPITVGLADGREVRATMIKLDSVKVGQFTVENVECCILGPEARDAPPLLGMSFLGQFKFEVDAQQAELKLLKVDSGEPVPKEKPREKMKASKKKK
jgi:aspartyl protease family protein